MVIIYSPKAIKTIVEMVMFLFGKCSNSIWKKIYKKKIGIVTEDNHSVSFANIEMHFIIELISGKLQRAKLFRQYINDIFFVSFGFSNTKTIETPFTNIFQKILDSDVSRGEQQTNWSRCRIFRCILPN